MDAKSLLQSFMRRMSTPYFFISMAAVAVIAVLGIRHLSSTPTQVTNTKAEVSHVQVASISDLSTQAGPLSVVGTVQSESQANILAQSAGEITALYHSIGDYVAAGDQIGQLENSSQRAAVVQAQGQLDAAGAALAKASGTTAVNSTISSSQAAAAANNAAASLAAALGSVYASLDDAVHTKADTLFTSLLSHSPALSPFTIPDSQLVINIENERLALNAVFSDAYGAANATSSAGLDARTTRLLADASQVESFLGDMIAAMNQAVPNSLFTTTTIAADQTMLGAARTEVVTAVSSVTVAKSTYDTAVTSSQSASNTATSGTGSDIAAAQAAVKSAQGTLDVAEAALQKTIIRSPISGIIVNFPITLGDYVTANQQIAIVSNPHALYADTDVTTSDAETLSIGNVASVNGSTPGVITFIAPALDPVTGKIEVKIGMKGDTSGLSDGENVTVSLDRNKTLAATSGYGAGRGLTIPIAATKITPQGAIVFTVTASSTLAAQPVTLGSILGDRIVVSGISATTSIVTDARGFSNGQSVIVDGATSTPIQ